MLGHEVVTSHYNCVLSLGKLGNNFITLASDNTVFFKYSCFVHQGETQLLKDYLRLSLIILGKVIQIAMSLSSINFWHHLFLYMCVFYSVHSVEYMCF